MSLYLLTCTSWHKISPHRSTNTRWHKMSPNVSTCISCHLVGQLLQDYSKGHLIGMVIQDDTKCHLIDVTKCYLCWKLVHDNGMDIFNLILFLTYKYQVLSVWFLINHLFLKIWSSQRKLGKTIVEKTWLS